MDISIDIVELPHKGVKLYCEDNGKPLPQCSLSTLAGLVDVIRGITDKNRVRWEQKR